MNSNEAHDSSKNQTNTVGKGKPPAGKPKLSKIEQKKQLFEQEQREAQLEIDRMQMAVEDELSLKAEIFNHRQFFA